MQNILSFLEAGGLIVGVIVALSIVMWGIMLDGFYRLHRCEQWIQTARAQKAWEDICLRLTSGYARYREQRAWGMRIRHSVAPHVRISRTLVTVLPLVGLLGTVAGMIHSFRSLASATQQGTLTDGIRRALLTTLAGLVTALSGVYTVYRLERKADRIANQVTTQIARIARCCAKKCQE